jgi:ABC-type glycerol-3-phosphate transport system permease component
MASSTAVRTEEAVRSHAWARRRRRLENGAVYAFLIVGALAVGLPYLWMILTSIKPEQDIFKVGIVQSIVPSAIRWENYVDAWTDYPLGRWLANSLIVGVVETTSVLITSILAGYAFAKLKFWGRNFLFYCYLGAMMVPIQVTLIPSFIIVKNLGMLNSLQGIAVLHMVQFYGVFLMRQFMLNIPSELEDAARIDGCNWLRVLVQIILPVSLPAVAALSILAFTGSWNNFLWPLVVINKPDIMTIVVGLTSMKSDVTPWGPLMAATTISALPLTILYVTFQRFFTQGIVMTGIKG